MNFRVEHGTTGNKKRIKREQVPCSPAFAMTDYRVQGQTYNHVIIDLVLQYREVGHRTFTAVYVALSRCRSLEGVQFARLFEERILKAAPSPLLQVDMESLNALAAEEPEIDEMRTIFYEFESGIEGARFRELQARYRRWDIDVDRSTHIT